MLSKSESRLKMAEIIGSKLNISREKVGLGITVISFDTNGYKAIV